MVALRLLPALLLIVIAAGVSASGEAPEDVSVEETEDGARVTWSAVEGAVAYRVYRNGHLVDAVDDNEYLDVDPAVTAVVYQVTAVTSDGQESEPSQPALREPSCLVTDLSEFPYVFINWESCDPV